MFKIVYSPHLSGSIQPPRMKEPLILGLNVATEGDYGHSSSAALIHGGRILALCEQERVDRIKESNRFPAEAARVCLETAKVKIKEIDAIALAVDPYFVAQRLKRNPETGVLESAHRKFCHAFGTAPEILILVNHHLGHAASAFYPSGFEKSLVVSWDGGGDNQHTVVYEADRNGIRQIQEHPYSLGTFYNKFRTFLNLSDKGSLMGLASYGKKEPGLLHEYYSEREITIHPALQFAQGGKYIVDESLLEKLGPPRPPFEPINQRHVRIAAQAQHVVETMCAAIVDKAYARFPCPRLCLAGGVALNATFNGMLWRKKMFKEIFIQPNAPDGGLALGAAQEASRILTGRVPECPKMTHAYYGPGYSEAEIKKTLQTCKIKARRTANEEELLRLAVESLVKGEVLGWFQGRMEWGPRALGNRSILADPRSKDMADKVNNIIKYRDEWRPFALSILDHRADDYLLDPFPDPFMITTAPVKEEKKKDIAAVVHSDGTTRPQYVSRHTNPRYARLLEKFSETAGVPGLLNTSFNLKGEPIVCTPKDALRTFYSSGLDVLVLGDFMIFKNGPGNGS